MPDDGATISYPTLGSAFDWRMRYLLTSSPDLHLAALGALKAGKRLWRLAGEAIRGAGWHGAAAAEPRPD